MHHGIGHMEGHPHQKIRWGTYLTPRHLVVITGDLIKLVHLGTPSKQHLVVATETEAHIWFPSGRYSSYWNDFLLLYVVHKPTFGSNTGFMKL